MILYLVFGGLLLGLAFFFGSSGRRGRDLGEVDPADMLGKRRDKDESDTGDDSDEIAGDLDD